MPNKVIDVPGLGTVAFPDTMSDGDIGKAITRNYSKAMPSIPDPTRANAPNNPITSGPEAQYQSDTEGYNGQLHGWDKPTVDINKIPLMGAFDPNSTSAASQVAQHTAKFIADQTTPKNAAIIAGAEVGAPLLGAGVGAAGPALGYTPEAAAAGAAKVVSGAHRVLGGYFGAMGAKGTLDNYRKTAADYMAGKPITGDVTDTVLNGAMAAFGLRGLIHDGTPPTNTQPSEIPAADVDHPVQAPAAQSVAQGQLGLQGQLFPSSEHSVPSASTNVTTVPDTGQLDLNFHPNQRDLFANQGADYNPPSVEASPAKESVAPSQMQLLPWQKNLFPKEESDNNLNQLLLNPSQGRLFSVKGEALPPQERVAGPMSDEAEAISKAAQDKTNPEPISPSVLTTEGPIDSNDSRVKALEDTIRTKTGQVMKLDQLVDGNQKHAALERAIDDYQSTLDPRRNAGPGISPEDQETLSIALGEKVGSTLTSDQVDKAYALRGKVMSETPELQLRPKASKDRITASRGEMFKDLETTQDPGLKAKLQDALQPGENGEPKPFLYEPARKNAPAIDLPSDHPEAPFGSTTFGATYPAISLDNLETALGQRPRSVDMGLGDPEMKAQLQGLRPAPTAEGTGTVKASSDGFGTDVPNNPKGYTGDAKALKNAYLEGAVRAKRGQIASELREHVKAYQNLRDVSRPSELIDQLKGVHPDSLPKEVKELVKPLQSKTNETSASASTRTRPQTAEARNASSASETPTVGKAKAGIVSLYDHFQKKMPEHIGNVQTLISKASEHFGNDIDGAMIASYNALKTFKQGIDEGNDWAMRDAIKEIRRMTPEVGANEGSGGTFAQSGAKVVNTRGGRSTFYTGLDPDIAKGIAKDVGKAAADIKNRVAPRLNQDDLTASAEYHANAVLNRYEQMFPLNRSAYKSQIHSDELTRAVAEGDPNRANGYQERLDALRKSVKPGDLYSGIKSVMQDNEQRILSQDVRQMIRRENGYRAGNDLRMEALVNKYSAEVDRWSNQESRDFIHKMELGLDQGDDMKNQISGVLRTSLDDARDRINGVNGNFQDYLENYFPHIWANVGKGAELSKQMRGMTGNESFLKNRELETFNEGIKQGLQPVTYNPLKMTMMRVSQMNRYAMKEQLKKEFVNSNNALFIEPGKSVPAGYVGLDDNAFASAGGLGGRYFAPRPVAKVFNDFVSTGLSGKWQVPFTNLSAYDALRSTNNTLNQFQLGLSGLHGTFTTVNSVLSEMSSGIAKGVNGDITGGLKTATNAFNVKGRYDLGKNLIAHMQDQNSFQELSSLSDAFQRAGGRVGVDKVLGTAFADSFKSSLKSAMDDALPANKKVAAWGKVAGNAIGATLETFSSPIMEKLVPRLKVGAFAMRANEILADNVGKPQAEIDAQLQKAWDNVDDRFGQMVYDNLFWDRTAKDIAMIATRAPGWNIGTMRAGAGGLLDLAKSVQDASRTKRFQITDRTAYLGAMVASTMAINAMLTMGLTGSTPHGADYWFARTGTKDANGEDNRLMPKMYTYDFINTGNHPVDTALHKVSPLFGTMHDLYANKSFYGREIYDPGSSVGGRMAQMAAYGIKQYEPFSISNAQEASTRGSSLGGSLVGSLFGVLPAPKWAGRSSAENLAAQYHEQSMAQGGEEGEIYDKQQKFVQLQADIKNGSVSPEELSKRVNSGEIPTGFLDHIYDKENTSNLERWTKALSPQRAMKVFDRATPEEKERLTPILIEKMDKLDPSEVQAYADKLNAASHTPDTHAFSVSKYAAANPGADHQAAASQAQAQGYEVRP